MRAPPTAVEGWSGGRCVGCRRGRSRRTPVLRIGRSGRSGHPLRNRPQGAARAHHELGARRHPGTDVVRVVNPTRATDGWQSPHTVIVNRHRRPAVRRRQRERRCSPRRLRGAPAAASRASTAHCWCTRRSTGRATRAILELRSLLRWSRCSPTCTSVVDDWSPMRDRALALAGDLRASTAADRRPRRRHRGGDVPRVARRRPLHVHRRPATKRAALRSAAGFAGACRPRLRAAGTAEPAVLTLTKVLERSTVHRAVPLDFVGVKRFDATGAVVGEQRFFGLYTATVYSESPRRAARRSPEGGGGDRPVRLPAAESRAARARQHAGDDPARRDVPALDRCLAMLALGVDAPRRPAAAPPVRGRRRVRPLRFVPRLSPA